MNSKDMENVDTTEKKNQRYFPSQFFGIEFSNIDNENTAILDSTLQVVLQNPSSPKSPILKNSTSHPCAIPGLKFIEYIIAPSNPDQNSAEFQIDGIQNSKTKNGPENCDNFAFEFSLKNEGMTEITAIGLDQNGFRVISTGSIFVQNPDELESGEKKLTYYIIKFQRVDQDSSDRPKVLLKGECFVKNELKQDRLILAGRELEKVENEINLYEIPFQETQSERQQIVVSGECLTNTNEPLTASVTLIYEGNTALNPNSTSDYGLNK